MVYRFDRFEVDNRELRLSEDGMPVQVEPKVLRLLVYLMENRNRLVRKQELLDAVWQDAMVTENALTRVIGLLRKALNDDTHNPRYLETVPTAGYRFIANVTVVENPAAQTAMQTPSITVPPRRRAGARTPIRWMVLAVVLIAIIIAGIVVYRHHARKILTEKDTIVLADFDNSTGDPVFDATLRRGMAVQLEQSPFLSLIPDDRIQQVLKEMGQPADARLTPAIAREICERTSSAAVLDGSIASLGSQYVLGLRAKDCQSGKVLAEEQVQAARKEDVLQALDQIAGKFRTQVGESLASVEKYDTPLAEATTSSLEALKAYSLGLNKVSAGKNTESLPFFSRAVELDPNIAAAYSVMSNVHFTQREPELAAENIRKAYELRDKVSERERLSIEANYYWRGTGELEKAISSVDLYQQTYPRNSSAHNTLGSLYGRLGNLEKSEQEFREALRLNPNHPANYQNLGAVLVSLNRLDEAEAVYKLSDERRVPYEGRAKSLYLLAFLKGDSARMAQLAASVAGKRSAEDAMLGAQADTEAWYGRMKAARVFTQRSMDAALNNDAKETAAGHQAAAALFEAESGLWGQSRIDANAAMKLAPNRDVRLMAALALAQAGDAASAEKLATGLDKDFPVDTLVQKYWLPTIRAAIALQRHDPNRAIELLEPARTVDLANSTNITDPSLFPVYVRGEAYLLLHDGDRAATEFQKFIDHRGLLRNAPIGMLARLGLARAYTLKGDTTKARTAYQDFLTTWKDADPEIPVLQQAKAEFAKLQ
jgi:DNA-binding winged helix-turn-helix (wHTH) protein/tetratricopeptide (TPR) repeat protein